MANHEFFDELLTNAGNGRQAKAKAKDVNTELQNVEPPAIFQDIETDDDEDVDLEVSRAELAELGDEEILETINGKETLKVVKGTGIQDPKVVARNVVDDEAWHESEENQRAVLKEIVARYKENHKTPGQSILDCSETLNTGIKAPRGTSNQLLPCLMGGLTSEGTEYQGLNEDLDGEDLARADRGYHSECDCKICTARRKNDVLSRRRSQVKDAKKQAKKQKELRRQAKKLEREKKKKQKEALKNQVE